MTYLSTENLAKSYGEKVLFKNITFGLQKGDKTALIANNGTGKTTLLKILAGKDTSEAGKVMVRNGIRIGYLEQEPTLDDSLTIQQFISQGTSETNRIIKAYEKAVEDQTLAYNDETHKAFEKAASAMDNAEAWDYEQRMEQILGKLNIHDLDKSIKLLSGGERKRVAMAFTLLDHPDLLILDEPTNHLDVDMIEWLEAYLLKSTMTLLMVTHDRYFLDKVCNHILEMEGGKLYHHKGNYAYFLEKKAEREEVAEVEYGKNVQLLKKELEWMRRAPKARTTKSKSRITAYYETQEKVQTGKKVEQDLKLEVKMSRVGGQILELKNVSKSFGDKKILQNFSYLFSKGERIGIIGSNGVGKSSFLKILTGELAPDSGEIKSGETVVYGHFSQKGIVLKEDKRVIEVLKDVAEVIPLANGDMLTASQFLEYFMFPAQLQYTYVSKLSGGERRRLGLLLVLIKNPNFLILDEPTNDLDLHTLNKLEDFLLNFGGCLILVTHDRFFMDHLVDHFFAFEGNGIISDHSCSYSEYREMLKEQELEQRKEEKSKSETKSSTPVVSNESAKPKMTYNEQKEFKKLEKEVADLEKKKGDLETKLSASGLNVKQINELSAQFETTSDLLDEKSMRWLELAEKV